MSHRKLLMQRVNDAIEAGHYRSKGTSRAKEQAKPSPSEDKQPEPAKKAEPAREPAKREPLEHGSFVQGLAARRRDAVGESVHKALDEKFKKQ